VTLQGNSTVVSTAWCAVSKIITKRDYAHCNCGWSRCSRIRNTCCLVTTWTKRSHKMFALNSPEYAWMNIVCTDCTSRTKAEWPEGLHTFDATYFRTPKKSRVVRTFGTLQVAAAVQRKPYFFRLNAHGTASWVLCGPRQLLSCNWHESLFKVRLDFAKFRGYQLAPHLKCESDGLYIVS